MAGVRELRDGRVVVLDARDQALKLVDMKGGTPAVIGRKGSGPGEYQLPLRLLALPGDSAVIFDMANSSKPMVITPEGKAGGILPVGSGRVVDLVSQVDAQGRIYRIGDFPGKDDLFPIERLDRSTGKREPVAYVSRRKECSMPGATATVAAPSSPGAQAERVAGMRAPGGPVPFLAIEQWVVAADGRVAILCPDPYRVSFATPDGRRTIGSPIVFERLPVTEAEKKRWRDEQRQPVATIRVTAAGVQSAGFNKRPAGPEPDTWPEFLPPYVLRTSDKPVAMFAPDGMLWVHRLEGAGTAPFCDVIGRDGRLAYRVTLPKRTRLVGFGANSVYLVRLDDDDIEYLQRYRLPK